MPRPRRACFLLSEWDAQVATTHRYAAADVEMMRNRLEKAGVADKACARFQPEDDVLRLLERI
jgi:hypothetical protein